MELFDAGLGDGAQPATLLKSPWDTGQSNASIIAIAIAGTGNSNVKLMLGAIGTLFIAAENIQLQAGYQARGYCSLRMFNDTAAAHDYGTGVTYGGVAALTNMPSSITFTSTIGTDANVSAIAAQDISLRGFLFKATVAANSGGKSVAALPDGGQLMPMLRATSAVADLSLLRPYDPDEGATMSS